MRALLVAAVVAAVMVSGCAADGSSDEVRVSAASSLTDAFTDIETAFESLHPEVDVVMNFAGSPTLRDQILEGAPVDVFASADAATMLAAIQGSQLGTSAPFAENTMAIAVPRDNPGEVAGLDDLSRPDLYVGLCAERVPCGALASEVLTNADVTPSVDTREPNVRSLLTKIEAGELDAGIVYTTDVRGLSDSVDGVAIPSDVNAVTSYPIAYSGDADTTAAAFVDFVLSDAGRSILEAHGFLLP